jgi:hypothetical protein
MTSGLLVRRRLDYLLLTAFVLGIINAIVLSLPEGLGVPVAPDSPWPPLRALHTWAVEQEPQHLVMPPALQASLLYDGFVQLPLLVILSIVVWRLRSWPWRQRSAEHVLLLHADVPRPRQSAAPLDLPADESALGDRADAGGLPILAAGSRKPLI